MKPRRLRGSHDWEPHFHQLHDFYQLIMDDRVTYPETLKDTIYDTEMKKKMNASIRLTT